ncbi:MAG: hypothetical protein RIM23_10640 [Coleofasciculus sp. G3-WIS-01]|jgi:hypothetical protein|uniref:hypothetical protein n=1 Tax=Coleofasciculus sp. G3-WIS-01 TaxID=3069528 RepID=UPI0032FB6033
MNKTGVVFQFSTPLQPDTFPCAFCPLSSALFPAKFANFPDRLTILADRQFS